MKLNKHQKAWIARLRSGKSRKCKNKLKDGKGAYCCLGVGIITCGETIPNERSEDTLVHHQDVLSALKLNNAEGIIDTSKVTKKWKDKFKLNDWHFITSLADLNDQTFLTHKEIGDFINENREAVFNN